MQKGYIDTLYESLNKEIEYKHVVQRETSSDENMIDYESQVTWSPGEKQYELNSYTQALVAKHP